MILKSTIRNQLFHLNLKILRISYCTSTFKGNYYLYYFMTKPSTFQRNKNLTLSTRIVNR